MSPNISPQKIPEYPNFIGERHMFGMMNINESYDKLGVAFNSLTPAVDQRGAGVKMAPSIRGGASMRRAKKAERKQ